MASKGKGGMEVLEAGGGDVLLFNRGSTGPAGILVPKKSLEKLGGTLGEGDAAWAAAMSLVEKRQATAIPVKQLQAASANLTEITLLMPPPSKGGGKGKPGKKAPAKSAKKTAPKAKPAAKKKKR